MPNLIDAVTSIPAPHDAAAADRFIERLGAEAFNALPEKAQRLMKGVAGASPYLAGLATRYRSHLTEAINAPLETTIANALEEAAAAAIAPTPDEQNKGLRRAKARAALCLGLAEVGNVADVLTAARLWSNFADAACRSALNMALRAPKSGFDIDAFEGVEDPSARCGIAVIAMGKHGAHELNYSSDIDLVIVYDPNAPYFTDRKIDPPAAKAAAVAATKTMLARLSDQTGDGYVFRTDIRLRPDPGVSAAAVSLDAAEAYYEAHGQNWERAAYIKARCAAGDAGVGKDYLARLRPFVWRRSLDYAAIEDIHSIKRQIHAAKGGAEIEFLSHDLKTGRGGIREIEFIAQTQQLILGGRDDGLRARATVEALTALADRGAMTGETADALIAHYRYLRSVEHRIQMIADEQTHKVPDSEAAAARLATFHGEPDLATFEKRLRGVLSNVHTIFSDVFGREEALSDGAGSLSFTGVDYDTATLKTLEGMGFDATETVAERVRRWHAGDIRSTRSPRSRELLTKFTPRLLTALAASERPDEAFMAFDRFLQRLPGGLQIFSLFVNNPRVFEICIRIMTFSPFLGRQLADRNHLIEAMTDASWPRTPSNETDPAEALDAHSPTEMDYEDGLNAVRRTAREARFEVSAAMAVGRADAAAVGASYATIAERAIETVLPLAEAETKRAHGDIDGALAVVALGRLGAGRMTAVSDVDLVFIYDCAPDARSSGPRQIAGAEYFARLVRRFLTAMTAPTEEGSLYEVDMQLRPSGRAGPAAAHIDAFQQYYRSDAWIWERMALVKARVIAGDAAHCAKLSTIIGDIQAAPTEPDKLLIGVRDMRARLLEAKPARSPWDVKTVRGGLTDLDFVLEYLALQNAKLLSGMPINNPRALTTALVDIEALSDVEASVLLEADRTFEIVLQLQRAAHGAGGAGDPTRRAPRGALAEALAESLGAADFARAEARLADCTAAVKSIYDTHIGAAE
ncbi:MAG: bifunctional [glutamine synthetase] adenylyltransferase/[glutamine synthetase]-adenylyl-L-tyrosine phosphorylase [Pseudomonadota bacterium]